MLNKRKKKEGEKMEITNRDNSIDLYDANFIEEQQQKIAKVSGMLSPFAQLLNDKMQDDNVEAITLHKHPSTLEIPEGKVVRLNNRPGEVIVQSDRKYMVQEDGSWKRIS